LHEDDVHFFTPKQYLLTGGLPTPVKRRTHTGNHVAVPQDHPKKIRISENDPKMVPADAFDRHKCPATLVPVKRARWDHFRIIF
jgi:hypothetical protein